MDEKPTFWDYFMARWTQSNNKHLKIYDRKSSIVVEYYRPEGLLERRPRLITYTIILAIMAAGIISVLLHWWPNIRFDLYLAVILVSTGLLVLGSKNLYDRNALKIVPEPEWEWSLERKRKKGYRIKRLIFNIVSILFLLLLFLNSYSAFYIRYLVEGGAPSGSAVVSIHTQKNHILLNNDTQEGTTFQIKQQPGSDEILIDIDIAKLPEQLSVYLNGQRIEAHHYYSEFDYFWESEYFTAEVRCFASFDKFKAFNTLEIKSGGFDKIWTFNLEFV